MKYANIIAAAAIAFVAAPAFAGQLAANAGLSPAEAQGLSLTEIAQIKFNRETRGDDRVPTVVPGSGGDYTQLAAIAGVSPEGKSLNEIFVAKINREARGDEKQAVKGGDVTMTSRSVAGGAAYAQLAASAGLSAADAAGMSLGEIAAAKFARESDRTTEVPPGGVSLPRPRPRPPSGGRGPLLSSPLAAQQNAESRKPLDRRRRFGA